MEREKIRLSKARTGTGYVIYLSDGRMFYTRSEFFEEFVDGDESSVSFIELPREEREG